MKNPDYPAPPHPAHVNEVRRLKARIAELEAEGARLRDTVTRITTYAHTVENAQAWAEASDPVQGGLP